MGLVITEQSFPESVKQHAAIDQPLVVQLQTGAKSDVRPAQLKISAEVVPLRSAQS